MESRNQKFSSRKGQKIHRVTPESEEFQMLIESGSNIKKAAQEVGINNSTAKDLARRLKHKKAPKTKATAFRVKLDTSEIESEDLSPKIKVERQIKQTEPTVQVIKRKEIVKPYETEVYPFENWWQLRIIPAFPTVTIGSFYYPLA